MLSFLFLLRTGFLRIAMTDLELDLYTRLAFNLRVLGLKVYANTTRFSFNSQIFQDSLLPVLPSIPSGAKGRSAEKILLPSGSKCVTEGKGQLHAKQVHYVTH